jgi:putative protease
MRITVGLDRADSPDRIEELHRAGADEFFLGLVSPEWSEHYGWEISPNRRSLGGAYQHVDPAEMAAAVACARNLGCPVFVTLNAHMYGPGQLRALARLVETCETMSPTGYIVADPAMLAQLVEWGVERPLNLSTGAACYNAEHVRWLAEIAPVRRVVLPRKLAFGEMRRLTDDLADLDIEFEAMATGYRCFFNDEFCFSWHSGADSMFCSRFVHGHYVVSHARPEGWKEQLAEALAAPDEQFQAGSALDRLVRGFAAPPCPLDAPPSPDGAAGLHRDLAHSYWNHCGLCALPRLRDAGVDVLKSPARGERWRKLRDVQVLRRVLDEPNPTPEFCRDLVGSEGFCDARDTCYYTW